MRSKIIGLGFAGFALAGCVCYKSGTADLDNQLPLVAHRSPSIEPTHTAFAKFGEPIDLLKDGLDGWESMNAKAKFVPGPIYLQGDHSDADYKNMILRPAI